jgi:hypothetical protein
MLIKPAILMVLFCISVFFYSPWGLSNETKKIKQVLEQLPSDFSQLGYTEVGRAKFTFLFWDIYKSALFTKTGLYGNTSSGDLIYKIEYLKDIKAEELIKSTVSQWQHLVIDKQQYQHFIPLLEQIWPDIKAGDSLTLYRNDRASVFYFNDKKVGEINDKTFGKLFLDIWLSSNTSEPELRKSLIGERHTTSSNK